jgi:hypothetical protein
MFVASACRRRGTKRGTVSTVTTQLSCGTPQNGHSKQSLILRIPPHTWEHGKSTVRVPIRVQRASWKVQIRGVRRVRRVRRGCGRNPIIRKLIL